MMLAEVTPAPDANHLLQFWLILSLTFSTLVSVGTFVVMVVNRKQKREVSFEFTPASKAEFDNHASECRLERVSLRAEIKAERDANQIHASERSKTIFNQIDKVRVELNEKTDSLRDEMQRNFQDTERALGRIEGKIDQGKT